MTSDVSIKFVIVSSVFVVVSGDMNDVVVGGKDVSNVDEVVRVGVEETDTKVEVFVVASMVSFRNSSSVDCDSD